MMPGDCGDNSGNGAAWPRQLTTPTTPVTASGRAAALRRAARRPPTSEAAQRALYVNFWPPTEASPINPPLTITNVAMPLL